MNFPARVLVLFLIIFFNATFGMEVERHAETALQEKFNWSGLPRDIKLHIMSYVGFKVPERISEIADISHLTKGAEKQFFSQDGKVIASAFKEITRVSIWGELNRGHGGRVEKEDSSIIVWDWQQRKAISTIRFDKQEITAMAWHPDGQEIAVATDCFVSIVGINNKLIKEIGPIKCIAGIAWNADGSKLACLKSSGQLLIYNINTEKFDFDELIPLKFEFKSLWGDLKGIEWNSLGDRIAVWRGGRGLYATCVVIHINKVKEIKLGVDRVNYFAWHPGGKFLAVGNLNQIFIYDTDSGSLMNECLVGNKELDLEERKKLDFVEWNPICSVQWMDNGNLLVGLSDRIIKMDGKNSLAKIDEWLLLGESELSLKLHPKDETIFFTDRGVNKSHLSVDAQTTIKRHIFTSESDSLGSRVIFIDPLKLHIVLQMLGLFNKSKHKIFDPREHKENLELTLILMKLGLSRDKAEYTLQEQVWMGPEEYDYYLYLKDELLDGISDIPVSLWRPGCDYKEFLDRAKRIHKQKKKELEVLTSDLEGNRKKSCTIQ